MYLCGNHVTIAADMAMNPFEILTISTVQCYTDKPYELQVWHQRPEGKRDFITAYGTDTIDEAEALHVAFWRPTYICSHYGSTDRGTDGSFLPPILRDPICRCDRDCLWKHDESGHCLYRGRTDANYGIPDVRFDEEIEWRNPGTVSAQSS